jgi:hypothetical protein
MIAGTLLACGPPPTGQPKDASDVAVDGTPGPGGVVVSDAATNDSYDRTPVPAPGELVLHFRWKNPGSTVTTAAGFANLPAGMVNAPLQAMVTGAIDEAVGSAVNAEELAKVVDLDAPIDMVAVADISKPSPVPEPMMGWSVGLTSLDAALATSRGKPEQLADGVWRVGTAEKWAASCAVAAAAGKAKARLVCVERKRHLKKMASYMARNVATMPEPAGDMHASLNLRGVLNKYGRMWSNQARGLPIIAEELKNGVPIFDKAIIEAANALAVEAGGLIADADSVHIDWALDSTRGMTSKMEIRFAGSKSWLVQRMLDGADQKGPPPAMFWHLPNKTDAASYARAGDPDRWTPVVKNVQSLLEGMLEGEKIGTAGDRRALAALLRLPTKKFAASVQASGHLDSPPAGAPPQMADMMDSMLGWNLVGIEDEPKAMKAWLNDAVRAYNRPTLQRLVKKEMGSDAKHLPRVRTIGAPRELGAGALAIEITIPKIDDPMAELNMGGPPPMGTKPPKAKTIDVKFHVVLMGDNGRTWLGMGADLKGLTKVMATVKGKTPGPDTIANRREWAMLKSTRHNVVSVTSLEGFLGALQPIIDMATSMAPGSVSGPLNKGLAALKKMPNRGKTPIVLSADTQPGAKPSMKVEMKVLTGTLEDLGFLGATVVKIIEDEGRAP